MLYPVYEWGILLLLTCCLTPGEAACIVSVPNYVGDGWCDKSGGYNTEACGWDGGDCCIGSCVSTQYSCGVAGYDCQDPVFLPTGMYAAM